MSVNLGARLGDRISIASFGTQRREAEATFKARVNTLKEDSNRLLEDIWSIEDKIEETRARLEIAKEKTSQNPDDVESWDSIRTLEKLGADLDRELRSVKRRNQLKMQEIEDKISLEETLYQAELGRLDEQQDQYLGDQDPDIVDHQNGSAGTSEEMLQTEDLPITTAAVQKKEDDLSAKMLELLTMQMKLLSQQQENKGNEKFFARQTTGKDLPPFSGDSSEWPAFVAQYKQTTEACGFSKVENLYRLEKALKGKAKSAVQALLTTPENVDTILKTLEEQFGQPRYIINSLLLQVRESQSPRDGKPETLIKFANNVKNMVVTVENLNRKEYLMNPTLLEELVSKLDNNQRLRWGEFVVNEELEVPSIQHFSKWLDKLSKSAQVIAGATEIKKDEKKNHVFIAAAGGGSERNKKKCLFCGKENHWIQECKILEKKTVPERVKWVKETKRCFSCLRINHAVKDCRSKKECKVDGCTSYHHPLLHSTRKQENKNGEIENGEVDKNVDTMLCTSCTMEDSDVLLRFLDVVLIGPSGEMKVWALCDEGATCSLLEDDVAKQLGITGKKEELVLKWTNDLSETHGDSEIVNLKVKSEGTREVFNLKRVRTIKDLRLPEQSINVDKLKNKFPYLKGVPASCQQAARPVLLLGEDNIRLTIAREVKEPKWEVGPVASKTKLGWTIHGPLSEKASKPSNYSFVISTPALDQDLHQLVKDSFKLESFGVSKNPPPKSEANKRAEQLLESTSRKCEENRWETGLLWKEDFIQFPPSKKMALSRLESVERNMEKDPKLREWYQEKIKYYSDAGYCKELSDEEAKFEPPNTFYLPHFAACNPNKPQKRRLVYDAAAKSCGTSLNDKLMTGPDLLNSLAGVLMRFRRWKIGFGADVKEMFHQIKITKEDVSAQRFLWRGGDRTKEPKVMAMNVMIFGAASSPCSAQFVMRKNADSWKKQYPEAVTSIHENMYMDDLADSAKTVEESKNRVAAINKIQDDGGFPMLKWTSSCQEVLVDVAEDRRAEPSSAMEITEKSMERVLGMYWKPDEDKLTFAFKFPKVNPAVVEGTQDPTKRDVLRMAMSLFDPLGIITFYTIEARMLLQDIWRSELDWDEKLKGKLLDQWNIWRKLLSEVSNVKISRCFSPFLPDAERIRLQVFCDAGEKAYSSVCYLEVKYKDGKEVNFVFGRARVTPLKPLSIPRLELLGAVMAVRMGATIKEEIGLKIDSTMYWTDSRNVLCWIRSDARNYKQFVGCKIGEILETSDVCDWRWVPTGLNPADEATRDTTMEITSNNIWITGPKFLYEEDEFFPVEKKITPPSDEELEVKAERINVIQQQPHTINYSRFSCFNRLVRSFAWIRRYLWILKIKARGENHKLPSYLLAAEHESAQQQLFKIAQKEVFSKELLALEEGRPVSKNSSLIKLSPFLDKEGIIRSESRIANGPFPFETRFPIILPGDHAITKMLLTKTHEKFGHGNNDGVLNALRCTYFITKAKKNLKEVIGDCMHCRAEKATPKPPRMGNLPEFRFGVNQPCFAHCGLDVFGPISITEGRRKSKRYVVLFTCLTTRAIHLEKISSLGVDSMIMAIRRFIALRNKPECLYSDNGTNMTGAYKEIKSSLKDVDLEKLESQTANLEINWKFIPPAAPHFGGCWERLIRCVKVCLYAALKSMHTRSPREEVLETLLCEAANIVNSRPLTDLPSQPGSEALTPNHFLKVHTSAVSSFGCYKDGDYSLRKQWRISQRLVDHFWSRWLREYLPTLQERKKWNEEQRPVKVGDFVYVADVNGIRGEWTKAIIINVFPGKDGRIRVVELRTPSGRIVKRPVTKCAVVNLEPGTGN